MLKITSQSQAEFHRQQLARQMANKINLENDLTKRIEKLRDSVAPMLAKCDEIIAEKQAALKAFEAAQAAVK